MKSNRANKTMKYGRKQKKNQPNNRENNDKNNHDDKKCPNFLVFRATPRNKGSGLSAIPADTIFYIPHGGTP